VQSHWDAALQSHVVPFKQLPFFVTLSHPPNHWVSTYFCKFFFLLPSLDLRIPDFEDIVPSKYILPHPADG